MTVPVESPDLVWPLAGGRVRIDGETGSPVDFVHDQYPEVKYLLDDSVDTWHSSEHRWGSGFAITPERGFRWNVPDHLVMREDSSVATFDLGGGLGLVVERRAGEGLSERYTFRNRTDDELVLGSIGINVPFRDVYEDAEISLDRGVHAHVWPGGANSWVIAEPMSGSRAALSLSTTEGELRAYSIDSRNQFTSSNVRGHIVVHPTDAARNPSAFGGQEQVVISPGGEWTIAWTVRWHESREAAFDAVAPSWSLDRYAAPIGEPITVRGSDSVRASAGVVVARGAEGATVTSEASGVRYIEIGRSQAAVLFHRPVRDIVTRRIGFIIERQRAVERGGIDAHAFVPYDCRAGLTRSTCGWPDWSDGAERLAMPTLIQQARRRGWVGAEVDDVLHDWADFARERLLDPSGAPLWGSVTHHSETRLYNAPWLVQFFADQFQIYARREDLDSAVRILERSIELGAESHLSIGHPEATLFVCELLDAAGEHEDAERFRQHLVSSARHFAELGTRLPNHEVRYEQSMVAPLVTLYAAALRIAPDQVAIRRRLPEAVRWMMAFGGRQPHVRLHEISIRHWDGYWFGKHRQWGDVFPHHWSVLTATALMQLASADRPRNSVDTATAIFAANLASFFDDGSATAAFVLPSTVDGVPAYRADPLANDQDWALTLLLRTGLVDEKGVGLRAPAE